MYFKGTEHYYSSAGEQCTRRAPFLILMQERGGMAKGEIRGIVRKVALRQCGHWMMGRVRIGAEWYTASGAYGHDGLTMDVADDAFQRGTPLPDSLREAWNKGGGWNSTGNEAEAMAEWAKTL